MGSKKDSYQEVTDRIVEALEEADKNNWECPWNRFAQRPRNGKTGRAYNGINVLLLWAQAQKNGYENHEWFTYKQAQKAGGHVMKGEKGTRIIYWNFIKVPKDSENISKEEWQEMSKEEKKGVKTKSIPLCRFYTVFNREQCEDLPEREVGEINEGERNAKIDEFLDSVDADTRPGLHAAYVPSKDYVTLPPFEDFKSSDAYYSVVFHEMSHWTGHESRCDRDLKNRFGSEAYAMEELVAELGSAFLCSDFEVKNDLQHPEYIKGWIDVLEDDKYAIFTAAREAKKAAEFLHDAAEDEGEGENTEKAA